MNGNRMKYTSTPTYGMQKRNVFKKSTPARPVPETPDFSQVPDFASPIPQQTMPVQPVMQQPQMTSPAAPYFPSQPAYPPMQQPGMQQPSIQQPGMQVPFVQPTFYQPGMQLPPVQGMTQPAPQQPLPLGNTMAAQIQSMPFSSHSQGFTPPPVQQPSMQQPFAPNVQTAQSTIPPFSGMAYQQPVTAPVPPVPPQQPSGKVRASLPAMDADKLWTIFLFGLLPLLFIPCLFVPGWMDFLRYAFLVLTVAGLGVMWYRQMFHQPLRMVISFVYVALCVVTIAMLMQGSSDARHASASLPQNAMQQTVPSPTPDMQAAVASQPMPTPTPEPEHQMPSEAENRLSLFMELWKQNQVTEMVNLVQPTWRNQQQEPEKQLFVVLGTRTPEDFTIEEISGMETDNSRTITMRATINKNTGKAPQIYRFMIMMVKEGGEWYVNPNSLATNDSEEIPQDENVVNNKNAGGLATPPPRQTVTPAPPADTTLYYNQGGNYYHMNPECPSVAKEYLPFDSSFSYRDLKSYKKDLQPCLACSAPVNPLPEE